MLTVASTARASLPMDQAGLIRAGYAAASIPRKENAMPGLRQLALALTCTAAAAILPAGAWATKRGGDAEQRTAALLAFQRDLVSVLAPRADAMPLLGAALLARPLPQQPKWNDFHTLIERAVAAPDHGPAQRWAQLADCDARAGTCPNAGALTALLEEAPDNAAAWLLKLGQDLHTGKRDDARTDLALAAQAHGYNDYAGSSLKALADHVGVLPPPPAVLRGGAPEDAAAVQAMIVFATASAQPQPGLPAVAQLCEEAGDDAALMEDCRRLGSTLAWGSSPLARSLGLHLQEQLAGDEPAREQARRERRDLLWQVRQFAQLSLRAQTDPALARLLLARARGGGTEMSLVLAVLRDAGLPTEAPPGWAPPTPGHAKPTTVTPPSSR